MCANRLSVVVGLAAVLAGCGALFVDLSTLTGELGPNPHSIHGAWSVVPTLDDFGLETGVYVAQSEAVTSPDLRFPYEDAVAMLVVGDCERVGLRFSEANVVTRRIVVGSASGEFASFPAMVDGERSTVSADVIGQRLFYLKYMDPETLAAGQTLILSIPWHAQGNARFTWSLEGAAAAIGQACSLSETSGP